MTYINFCYRLVCVQRLSQNLMSILPWHLSSLYFTDGQNSPFLRLRELQRITMYTRIKSKLSKELPDRSGILWSPSTGWLFQSCLNAFVVGQRLLSLLQDVIYWRCQFFCFTWARTQLKYFDAIFEFPNTSVSALLSGSHVRSAYGVIKPTPH